MRVVFVLGVSVLVSYIYGSNLQTWLDPRDPAGLLGPVMAWVAGMVLGGAIWQVLEPVAAVLAFPFRMFRGGRGSVLNTVAGRRLMAALTLVGIRAVIALPYFLVPVASVFFADRIVLPLLGYRFPWGDWRVVTLFVVVGYGACFMAAGEHVEDAKIWLAWKTVGLRRFWHQYGFGEGGSAQFAGKFDNWMYPWKPGSLRVGTSLFDRNFLVGIPDDRHFITIATNRSGKGTSCIIPNLLTYPGSILCIDPKGENAAVTAEARRRMGQDVHILDPFGVLAAVGVMDKISRYNPLDDINPLSMTVFEDIDAFADALLKPDLSEGFWDDASRNLFSGLVAHLKSWPGLTDADRHLGTIHKWITTAQRIETPARTPGGKPTVSYKDGLPLDDMLRNPLAGGIPEAVAGAFVALEEKTKSGVYVTARTNVKWLNSPAIRASMSGSDFSMYDLKKRPTTIYLVIPPTDMQVHAQWLRLCINTAMNACVRKATKAPYDVLILMDEFYALGRMDKLSSSASNLGSYGVKLWPIIQNIGQLEELYAKNWQTFMGNAGMWQVFAVNDQQTVEYFSNRLGMRVRWSKQLTPDGPEWYPQNIVGLRTPQEIASDTSKESGRQFIFREGGECYFLGRQDYRVGFPESAYRNNPMQERGEWETEAGDDEQTAETPAQ